MSVPAVETQMDVALDRHIPMGAVRDTIAIIQRNLIAYRRVPQLLVFSTIQPVIFVVMFRYVFGGAVSAALTAGVD
jgi:ABC-2 type transport system permease protein/oleandomycin transport system permease protein